MKRLFITLFAAFAVVIAACAQSTSEQIESYLSDWQENGQEENTELFFARKFLGVPYVAHTLEQKGDERLVVNLKQLDCTTLVETVVALTICAQRGKTTYDDYQKILTILRYRHGRLNGYVSRLHYFTDWIIDNSQLGLIEETQSPNPPFTAVQRINVNYMSTHPSAYSALKAHPEWVNTIAKTEKAINGKTFRYIPKSQVANTAAMREAVKDGDIIAITCNKKGLDIAHLGFAVWKKDGLHLLNASSIHKKVVEESMTLRQYLMQHPSHTGIRVVKVLGSE